MLQKLLPCLLVLASLLWSCENEIIFEPVLDVVGTCSDGKKNGDEENIDCGGRCAACEVKFQPAPCKSSLQNNILTFQNKNYNIYSVYEDQYASFYTIRADFSRYGSIYTDIIIRLPMYIAPEKSTVYKLGPAVSFGNYSSEPKAYLEVYFDGFDGGYYESTNKGLLYVEVVRGNITIEFCEVELTTSSGFKNIFSGRLII